MLLLHLLLSVKRRRVGKRKLLVRIGTRYWEEPSKVVVASVIVPSPELRQEVAKDVMKRQVEDHVPGVTRA